MISFTIFHPAWPVISISGVLIQFRITNHWNQTRPKTSPSLISRLEKWAGNMGNTIGKTSFLPCIPGPFHSDTESFAINHFLGLQGRRVQLVWQTSHGQEGALEVSISESIQLLTFVSRKHELKANQMYSNITICINMKQSSEERN